MRFAFVYVEKRRNFGDIMENCDIYKKQSLTCLALSVHISEICALTDSYLNGFDRKDFFVFTDLEEQNKLYKKEYYAFVSKLPAVATEAQEEMAKLSALLVEADAEGALDALALIGEEIEGYVAFEKALNEYLNESRSAISESKISPSRLVSAARKLKSAAENLLKLLRKEEKNG